MKKTLLLFLFAAMILSAPAKADTVYTYTGNPYTFCAGTYSCNGTTPALSVTFDTTLTGSALDNLTLDSTGNITADITSFTITDGSGVTITLADAPATYLFDIGTDGNGAIQSWAMDVFLSNSIPFTDAFTSYDPFAGDDGNDQSGYGRTAPTGTIQAGGGDGDSYRAPGIWSSSVDPVATPEPSNLLLLSSGLIGLGFMKRKVFQN